MLTYLSNDIDFKVRPTLHISCGGIAMPVPFRYRKLGYVALNVTDIARTTEFATRTFVLENSGTGPSGEQFLSCGPEHHDVVLYQSKEPGFVRGAWELESP